MSLAYRPEPVPALTWLRWRALTRLVLAAVAGLTAIGAGTLHEQLTRNHPPRDTLLFPAKPARVASSPATPAPIRARALPPAPDSTRQQHTCTFTVTLATTEQGLALRDFRLSGTDPDLKWELLSAERQRTTRETHVAPQPLSVVLLFDQSGSIRDTDPEDVRLLAAQAAVRTLPEGTRFAVAHFQGLPDHQGNVQPVVQVDQEFTTDPEAVHTAIARLRGRTIGGTPLFTALLHAIALIEREPYNQPRVIICLSDGLPDADDPELDAETVVRRARAANVQLHFVALGDLDWTLLRTMARPTRGSVVPTTEPERLINAFAALGRKLQQTEWAHYRLEGRVYRTGRPVAAGETLRATLHVAGHQLPLTVQVAP
ncbi:MAG: VWA domain-containing protein [Chloroherpetonaceae bacterium]|nr:VWA domain-containing protein [Chthonomonadaceae bacterium]MDW8206788.1 VWA domain-containing protein [Chloroherpetonaceae bacterium]